MSERVAAAERLPFPGFWQSLGLVLFLSVAAIPFVVPVLVINSLRPGSISSSLEAFAGTLAFIPVIWVGVRFSGKPWREALALRPIPYRTLLPFMVATVGLSCFCIGVDALVVRFLPEPVWLQQKFLNAGFFVVALGAPLTEEPLCRGLFLGGLNARYGLWRAIVLSALLFALMHMNPWQFLPPFLMGLVYGWVALATGSIALPMLGHFINNAGYLLAMKHHVPFASDQTMPPLWFWLASAACLWFGLRWLQLVMNSNQGLRSKP